MLNIAHYFTDNMFDDLSKYYRYVQGQTWSSPLSIVKATL